MKTIATFLASCCILALLTSCSSETTNPPPSGSARGGSNGTSGGTSSGKGGTSAVSTPNGSGGASTGNGGSSNSNGGSSASVNGGSQSSAGGRSATNGSTGIGGNTSTNSIASSSGGSGLQSSNGSTAVGGTSASSSGSSGQGGSSSSVVGGSSTNGGASSSNSATGGAAGASVVYELPPPSQCHDQDYIPYDYQAKKGCLNGDASTDCGGKCQVINACLESTADKPNADITFMCPRNLLFSAEMEQAAADDGNAGFHYAVVGHDIDSNGVDKGTNSACCQCYQLVYAYPSPANDRQVLVDPNNSKTPTSAVPLPPPLIVQAFNTAATPTTFDVYMPAGGLGANNACAKVAGASSRSGQYMYTAYPEDGQPGSGGVKPVSLYSECKTKDTNMVTTETFTSSACQQRIKDTCNKITSSIPGLTELARTNCVRANSIDSLYHLNWSVYVMKVECPEHLTRVTGCKLASQGLPKVKTNVTTATQAALDKDFWGKTGSSSTMYETTTMEDCCRPSCAAINWISGKGLTPDPQYRAFYTCDVKGVPYTQKP